MASGWPDFALPPAIGLMPLIAWAQAISALWLH